MRKTLQTAVLTVVWLLASPTLQLRESAWLEVGAPPAAADAAKQAQAAPQKKAVRRTVRSSAPIPPSVAPGLYPMQPVVTPEVPVVTGTVVAAPQVPGYPKVPTVAIVPRGSAGGAGLETSQDRVVRCTHQAALGGLPAGERGAYIHTCAFP